MARLTLLVLSCLGLVRACQAEQPNVVIFFTDDQGTLDASCYGSKDLYTPNIDKLAETGVRFTQAYAHAVCCPARAMLMTGRYPQRGGVNNWTQGNLKQAGGTNMALSEYTLAEHLKDHGYRTALFGKWHLGADKNHGPTKQGFDQFWGHRGGFIDNYNHHFLHGKGFHDLYEGTKEVLDHGGKYFPDEMTRRAVQFIGKNKSKTFFLYCAFNLPHYPEQADKAFASHYLDVQDKKRRSYGMVVSTVDNRIGQIVDALEKNGLREKTIIIFMSDNGHSEENFSIRVDRHSSGLPKGSNYGANGGGGNTGKWKGRKGQFFEGGIRVPAIISYPAKLPQGAVRNQLITAMDWMPTVAALTSTPMPRELKLDGFDLRDIIASETNPTKYDTVHWMWQNHWMVRQGNWKLYQPRPGRNGKATPAKLFNLADSQPERQDYSSSKPELVKKLRTLHEEWRKDVTAKSKDESNRN